MTSRHSRRPVRESDRAQARQLPLLALCVFGLVVAALALPPADANGASSDGGALPELPEFDGNVTIDPGDVPIDIELPEGRMPDSGCLVVLGGEPVPGSDLAVYVVRDRQPVPDTRVWFNGRRVGRTDDRGRVVGRVPYDRELNVRVGLAAECAFVTPDGRRYDQSLAGGADAAALTGGPEFGATGDRVRQTGTAGNDSATVPVDGEVQVGVRGEPYPGETVTVAAAVSGVPFRNAGVFVDGERVGRTDDRGRYRLQVPDRERVTLRVERGDFAGARTLQVWTLSVSVQPRGLLAVPGESGTLQATLGPRPAADAPVFVDGERVGRTDSEGQLRLDLPDSGATVEVRARGQVEQLPMWAVYLPSVALVAGLLGLATGSTAAAGRRYGRRVGLLAAAGWLTTVALLAGYVLGGWPGLAAAAGLVAVPWAAIAVRYRGEDLVPAGADGGGLLGRLARRGKAVALALADGLSGAADRLLAGLRGGVAWCRALPARLRAVLAAPAQWLAAAPGRLVSAAAAFAEAVGAVPGRALGRYGRVRILVAGALLVAAVSAGYVLADAGGAVAGLGVWTVAVVALALLRRRPDPDRADESPGETTVRAGPNAASAPESEPGEAAEQGPETLRELWRQVARRVAPRRWRSSTPAEVERAATDRGLPAEPVERIAEVFREVEYGDRPLSDRRWHRARAAYDRLRETWDERDRGGREE
ncbi:DUF4129 domain-containing protein [Salinirussus salinus]|uniref:DUF4129 domain-containing protein n=1 Tax=Salinirussus salinus TaxID=1198300 RepID=UPI00135A026F|nr:DUF4129 domain-containing protein [Salinirussus salinus]